MPDQVLYMGDAVVQHGPSSDRVYVMELGREAVAETVKSVDALADREGYGKVIVKARVADYGAFALKGYRLEAVVPGYFGPHEPGLFLGRFLDAGRETDTDEIRVREVLAAALEREPRHDGVRVVTTPAASLAEGLIVREMGPDAAVSLAACYRSVFASYPFPIDDPDHLCGEMERGTRFFGALEDGALLASSSMEPGGATGTVEMTDFATYPESRGRGLAAALLDLMDREASSSGVRVAYTIARATSFGMNITFARRGYRYGGTLVNNTQISGGIESMNVWFKLLSPVRNTPS